MENHKKYNSYKEALSAAQKAYYLRNKEKICARQRAYNEKNRETIREKQCVVRASKKI